MKSGRKTRQLIDRLGNVLIVALLMLAVLWGIVELVLKVVQL